MTARKPMIMRIIMITLMAMITAIRTTMATTPATPTEPAIGTWLPALLQMGDSFYPTGGYAHSFGLEGVVQAGWVRDLPTLRDFLVQVMLPALGATDLPVAALAWRAGAPRATDWAALEELCFLGAALRGAREPRAAAEAVGGQRLQLAARLRGGLAATLAARAAAGQWPLPAAVVAAIEARTIGAPIEAPLAALVYAAAATLLSAAVKLLRLGQNAVQHLLTEILAAAAPLMAAAARTESIAGIGSFTPWWDLAASRHESADFRLFIS